MIRLKDFWVQTQKLSLIFLEPYLFEDCNKVLNAAKPGHSADPVSAVTKKVKRQDVGGR